MTEQRVIEFRNGGYFQSLDADSSGPKATAQRFASEAEADDFMRVHTWVAFGDGMPVRVTVTK